MLKRIAIRGLDATMALVGCGVFLVWPVALVWLIIAKAWSPLLWGLAFQFAGAAVIGIAVAPLLLLTAVRIPVLLASFLSVAVLGSIAVLGFALLEYKSDDAPTVPLALWAFTSVMIPMATMVKGDGANDPFCYIPFACLLMQSAVCAALMSAGITGWVLWITVPPCAVVAALQLAPHSRVHRMRQQVLMEADSDMEGPTSRTG